MTDDTSDDRMDRARRIREMREGNRPDAESDAPESDEGEPTTDASDSGDGDPEPTTDAQVEESGDSDVDTTAAGEAGDDEASDGAAEEFPGDWDSPGQTADDEDAEEGATTGVDIPTDENGVPQLPGIDMDEVDAEQLAEQAGLDTGDAGAAGLGTGEAASTGVAAGAGAVAGDADDGGARAVGMAGSSGAVTGATAEDETRVLEFALGEERYCLDIDHVEEIVKRETVTRVPNTPEYVEGVVDLRGQITTILDPKVLFDIDVEGPEELIVVFDPEGFEDQGAIGWLVDDVNQVMPVAESEVNDSPVDQEHVEGVVDRDGEFVIWTKPELAVEDATS